MMTPEERDEYHRMMDRGRTTAIDLGRQLASGVRNIVRESRTPINEGIDPIFAPLIIEPIIRVLDYAYDEIGQSNFWWVIDLYIGRKMKRVMPLLLAIADKLCDGRHDKDNKAEGGGPDHYFWLETHSISYTAMRWDTQSRSYYISISKRLTLDIAEYDYGQPRGKAEHPWQQEPGHVLKFEATDSCDGFGERIENAGLSLPRINRFLSLVNPFCTALDINLYKPPFDDKPKVFVADWSPGT